MFLAVSPAGVRVIADPEKPKPLSVTVLLEAGEAVWNEETGDGYVTIYVTIDGVVTEERVKVSEAYLE